MYCKLEKSVYFKLWKITNTQRTHTFVEQGVLGVKKGNRWLAIQLVA